MRPFEYLQKQIGADVREFVNTSTSLMQKSGVTPLGADAERAAESAEPRASLSSPPPEVWLSAAARMRAGDSAASSPDSIIRAIESAFAHPDAISRGAYWWLIAEAWEASAQHGDVPRRLGVILAARFGIDPTFACLEDVASMWINGIRSVVNGAKVSLRREVYSGKAMEGLAGADRAKIARSVVDAAQFLVHALPERRIAAIKAITDAQIRPAWFPAKLRDMALSDPDQNVSTAAVVHLTTIFGRTRDASTLAFLARIAVDHAQPKPLRFFAYHGLYVVSGAPSQEWPYYKVMKALDDFGVSFVTGKDDAWPCDMDWAFAASFLNAEDGR